MYFTGALLLHKIGTASVDMASATPNLIDMIDDPGLNYFALGLLLFIVIMMFYTIIAIHDIPAKIAESRHHPHADAIHAAKLVYEGV